jgi:hypothetical protein
MTFFLAPEFLTTVRLHVFGQAATTGRVPQAPEIASALGRTEDEVKEAIVALGRQKALILAPNDAAIWSANPFCAVRSGFRVESGGKTYWGICVWDALGVLAALDADGSVSGPCGDCGATLHYQVRDGRLVQSEEVVHFAVPARHWWDNIGFT